MCVLVFSAALHAPQYARVWDEYFGGWVITVHFNSASQSAVMRGLY